MLLIALLACDASDPMDSSDSAPVEAGIRWVVVDYVCGDGTTYTFTDEAPISATVITRDPGDPDVGAETWGLRPIEDIVRGSTWSADSGPDSYCMGSVADGRLVLAYL